MGTFALYPYIFYYMDKIKKDFPNGLDIILEMLANVNLIMTYKT